MVEKQCKNFKLKPLNIIKIAKIVRIGIVEY